MFKPNLQVALPEDPTGAQRFVKRDASLALRNSEAGVVDQVLLTTSEAGQTFVKVRVRSICIPQVRLAWAVLLCSGCLVVACCDDVDALAQHVHPAGKAGMGSAGLLFTALYWLVLLCTG
jgi:hypothetical protein